MKDPKLQELCTLINTHDYYWRFIDEQRKWDQGYEQEQTIKGLLKSYLWEDIEPYVKEDWRQEKVKSLF